MKCHFPKISFSMRLQSRLIQEQLVARPKLSRKTIGTVVQLAKKAEVCIQKSKKETVEEKSRRKLRWRKGAEEGQLNEDGATHVIRGFLCLFFLIRFGEETIFEFIFLAVFSLLLLTWSDFLFSCLCSTHKTTYFRKANAFSLATLPKKFPHGNLSISILK